MGDYMKYDSHDKLITALYAKKVGNWFYLKKEKLKFDTKWRPKEKNQHNSM